MAAVPDQRATREAGQRGSEVLAEELMRFCFCRLILRCTGFESHLAELTGIS
jgi:hypothetical protein